MTTMYSTLKRKELRDTPRPPMIPPNITTFLCVNTSPTAKPKGAVIQGLHMHGQYSKQRKKLQPFFLYWV